MGKAIVDEEQLKEIVAETVRLYLAGLRMTIMYCPCGGRIYVPDPFPHWDSEAAYFCDKCKTRFLYAAHVGQGVLVTPAISKESRGG